MDVTYSMISVNSGGIREYNRRDLVINYCKTLDTDFSILQKALVNFFLHLHDIRELWNSYGVLALAKRTATSIEQIITDPGRRYVYFKIKNTTDPVLAIYAPSGTMKERRVDRQIFIRKIKKLL